MLGRASAAMTLDVYAGLFANDLNRVAELMHKQAVEARTHRPAAAAFSGPGASEVGRSSETIAD